MTSKVRERALMNIMYYHTMCLRACANIAIVFMPLCLLDCSDMNDILFGSHTYIKYKRKT